MERARPDLGELLRHAAWMRQLARMLVRDEALADDLVQETWLAALRSPPRAGEPPRPWLAQVLRNAWRMRRRGDGRRHRREEATEAARAHRDGARQSDGARLVEALQAQRQLAEALLALDEPWRTTLLLHYYEGLSAADLAARQKLPAATVRGRLREGRERLRAVLDRAPGGRGAWLGSFVLLAQRPQWAGAFKLGGKGMLMTKSALAVGGALLAAGGAALLAREHAAATMKSATAKGATLVRSGAPASGATQAALPATTTGKLSPQLRAEMLRRLGALHLGPQATAPPQATGTAAPRATSAPASAGDGEGDDGLDRAYIRQQMSELSPLLRGCYEEALERKPALQGRVMMRFSIVGDPTVGGLVGDSEVDASRSDIDDAQMTECLQETMYAAQFRAPAHGGEVDVDYPFVFRPSGPPPPPDTPTAKATVTPAR